MLLWLILPLQMFAQSGNGAERENPAEREDYFYRTRAYPFDRIPQNARLDALLFARTKMRGYGGDRSPQSLKQWRPIGPFDLGGRVTTIAVHPTDGKTLWIGAAYGGVWKSTDRGVSWTPTMDRENAIAMGALAVDPSNPDILYAGTGEAAINIDSYNGAGVMKSTDGGSTWRGAGLASVAAFARIAVHPKHGNIVFAAATKNNAGFYRSSDGGASWTRVSDAQAYDITLNPTNPDELWVGGGPSGVLHSTDAGLTLAPLEGIATDGNYIGRVSVQVAPSNPRILYALTSQSAFPDLTLSRIYKSTDGGASWDLILDNDPDLLNYYGHPQGEYNNVLAVKPDDPNVVMAGGVVLLVTTDGGGNWRTVEHEVHPDYHAIAFDPTDPRRLYVGNDGGVYISDDAGETFNRSCRGLAITQFYAMAIDQKGSATTYGGTQDNGTVDLTASDYWGGSPGVIGGGDGFHVVIDANDSDVIYFEQPHGELYRTVRSTGARTGFSDGLNLSSSSDVAAWSAPFLSDPTNPALFYCGRSMVYRRTATTPWKAISPPFRTPISAIGISPADGNVIYAGSGIIGANNSLVNSGLAHGQVMTTRDGGKNWRELSGTGLPDRVVTAIVGSPTSAATAYICYSGFYGGHIFRTTDYGDHWSDISVGLPDIPVNALAIHPDDEGIIYAGTDIGVFITTDAGATWGVYNQGLPNVVIADLAIHRTQRVLRAATHGRSMWEIELEKPERYRSITAPIGREVWMGRTPQTIAWSGFTGPVEIDYSLDDGVHWQPVAGNLAGGTMRWSVVDSATPAARIRVTSMQAPSEREISPPFSIEKFAPGGIVGFSVKPIGTWGLAYDGEYLWGVSQNSDTLLKLDPRTLTTLAVVPMSITGGRRYYTDLAYHPDRGTLFLHQLSSPNPDDTSHGWLLEIGKDGRELHRWVSPCYYPGGLAWMGEGSNAYRYLLASDFTHEQNFYLIDPDNGATVRTIPRGTTIDFGPAGLASGGDGESFWQVIDDFDINSGPRGSTAVRMGIEKLSAECVVPLRVTPDSTLAFAEYGWGRLFANGIERDPSDGNLWVSNLDGSIYKVTACAAASSSVPVPPHSEPLPPVGTLSQNHPNPFSGATTIGFTLTRPAEARILLYDAEGGEVAIIASGSYQGGSHSIRFDPAALPSGLYRYALLVDGVLADSRGMLYVK
jgi:photosystem II stability/assembly factor-like uncharacterized protein